MLYFRFFPKIEYEQDSSKISLIDLSVRSKVLNYLKQNNKLTIDDYVIEQNEKPEEVSYEVYSSYDYTWTILALNDVYSIHNDWYVPPEILDRKILHEFGDGTGSIEIAYKNAQDKIVSYYDVYGYEVSSTDRQIDKTVSAFDRIMEENERKRYIKVFSPTIIRRIQADFESDLK